MVMPRDGHLIVQQAIRAVAYADVMLLRLDVDVA